MKITLKQRHKCLEPFEVDGLSKLTIITGKNGVGKSALLDALDQGYAVVEGVSQGRGSRVLLTSDKIRVSERPARATDEQNILQGARQALAELRRRYPETLERLPDNAKAVVQPLFESCDLLRLQALIVQREYETLAQFVAFHGSGSEEAVLINQAASARGKPCVAVTESELFEAYLWGGPTLFEDGLSRPFALYQSCQVENWLAELRTRRGPPEPFLTDEQFIDHHGAPPWEIVNRALAYLGLPYKYDEPRLGLKPEPPTLRSTRDGTVVPLSAVSSGEGVLFGLAHSLFNGKHHRGFVQKPALVLLDEVDAFLHPEMARRFMDFVLGFLIGEMDISVIAVTHSPSTVALAPPTSIYVMERGGELKKASKPWALNVLTEGVPTLAIDFDGRRQVFTESAADAKTYNLLYQMLMNSLPPERSLEFISTGTRSGCAEVTSLVGKLVEAGNTSVFGLIDSDQGRNQCATRIHVLCDGTHDGLENVILNPLLLSAFICHSFQQYRDSIGLNDNHTFTWICQASTDWQDIAARTAEFIFKSKPGGVVGVRYLGGFELELDERCFNTDDHAYEDLVLKAFPSFEAIARKKGGSAGLLMQRIAQTVVAEQPSFLPLDMFETLQGLLTADAHVV